MIQMINKERAPTTRHVSWTLRVDLDCLIERLSNDKSILLMHVRTTDHVSDILTYGSFTVSQLQELFQHWQLEPFSNVSLANSTSLKTVFLLPSAKTWNDYCEWNFKTGRQFDGTMTRYVLHIFHGATTNEIQRHIDGWISSGQDSDGNVYSLLNPVFIE